MSTYKDHERPENLVGNQKSHRNHEEGLTAHLSNTRPVDKFSNTENNDEGIGAVYGGQTGEEDCDVVAGGWAGTDDATSTAPSDMAGLLPQRNTEINPDAINGRGYGGGLDYEEGGVSDLTGSPVEESRDWTVDAVTEKL
jgi:hypothetical protein